MMDRAVFSVVIFICMFGISFTQMFEECRTDAFPPSNPEIERVVVNLDLPPIRRWADIVRRKQKELKGILEVFKELIGEKYLPYVETIFGLLLPMLPEPYSEELKGISIAADMNRGEVTVYNVFYELFTVCTSIVGEDEDGNMYHGRNMDFGLLMGWDTKNNSWLVTEHLRRLLIDVDFQKNGKTVYRAVTFVGYVGVLTAMKKDAFTFTIDERFILNGGWVGLLKWIISRGKSRAAWLGFFARDVMLNATSYRQAKRMFSNKQLIAPAYFILSGTQRGEACILTRGRIGPPADIWELKSKKNPGQWYILETNYDHWKKPLFLDDRRTPANKCMKEMTQKSMGFKGLFNVLSTKPVRNKLTAYTALMQARGGIMRNYIQYCPDPCWPW